MKKTLICFVTIFSSVLSFSQSPDIGFVKKSKEPFKAINGLIFKVGDTLRLGTGQALNGDFKSVRYLNNFNAPIRNADNRMNNRYQVILYFKNDGKEEFKSCYAFTKYCMIDIDNGIRYNELVTKSLNAEEKEGNLSSIADELTKFKKLYDEGILTKDEFEQQKNRLLNK
jgi:hypothetical protein